MALHTKLFKIGESALYGKWRLTLKGNTLTVEGIDYFTNKVEAGFNTNLTETGMVPELRRYLEAVSTIYWADTMLEWLESVYPSLWS
jgi:hypothetical protein